MEHLKTQIVWLTELMFDSGSDVTNWDELEHCDQGFVFKQLSNPHDRVDQGFVMSGWRTAKVDIDKCQCTLEQETSQIDL